MYESFGALVNHKKKTVQFKLFFPDHRLDKNQYFERYSVGLDKNGEEIINLGGLPDISQIAVKVGDEEGNWKILLKKLSVEQYPNKHPRGYLYQSEPVKLKDGFFQYKYVITFKDGEIRECNDPCTKYHHFTGKHDNSAFVIGGPAEEVRAIPDEKRLPLKDLIIYEVMLDDFTDQYRGEKCQLDAFLEKIPYLEDLGINAVEFMPWTGWPGGEFNWGYMPFLFFSVTNRYTHDPDKNLEKLTKLKTVINELHKRNIHVIMDGVFDHVCDAFPYYNLYKDRDLCPYTGIFSGTGYGVDLDFYNRCTQEFILDVCKYWLDTFKIDGIRFDYTLGFFIPGDYEHGITKLIRDLDDYKKRNISFILEHINGYQAIDDTNQIDASGCWLDPFMWKNGDYIRNGLVDGDIIRVLDSSKDFYEGKVPVIYLENHDHAAFINNINNRNNWWKTQPYVVELLTSPGAVMIHNGQEFGYDYRMPEFGQETEEEQRVSPRHLDWNCSEDETGQSLFSLYKRLIELRKNHAALRSANFYPSEHYSSNFNDEGYGFSQQKQVVIYHRYEEDEKFIVVLNFSDYEQVVDIPFSEDGEWEDVLLPVPEKVDVNNCVLENQVITPNWGKVYKKV